MPAAIRYGIDINTFWSLNPKIMFAYQDAHLANLEEGYHRMEVSAYVMGVYNMQSIAAVMGGNKNPYPHKLLGVLANKEECPEELTEEQKVDYQKKLLMQLQVMQSNFETKNL